MEGFSLKSRAITFAICAGAVAFILALVATSNGRPDIDGAAQALIAAIVCGTMCWASTERTLSAHAIAIDSAIQRLTQAAQGDLAKPVPAEVGQYMPPLATAMADLFRQLDTNLENVQRLAMYDPVTALPNRVHFRAECERMLIDCAGEQSAALFFLDLDRFKTVNDTLGHATGDILLGMVADRLRAVAGAHTQPEGAPLIGRLAGDEFTMFFPALPDPIETDRIGAAILSVLREPFVLADQQVAIGASIGIALRPAHGTTLTELMRAADAAMYHAKAEGRGRVESFSDTLAARIAARGRLEGELRDALDRREFALAFQPQVSAIDGHLVGAEALLRWQHPDGERLPGSFLQCAEESGLMIEIGERVVDEVAAVIARWAAMGIERRMAINVSPRQLDHADFFHKLRRAMLAAQAPAAFLELEISETLAMHCSAEVIAAIALLRDDGATIAIDDFGTGYSNIARLRMLPIDRIKLDRSLTGRVATDGETRTIAQAVIALIHGLNCEAVAEGIEDAAQAEVLRILGCDVLQGYAVALPMDEAAFLAWQRLPRTPPLMLSLSRAG